MGVTRIRGVNVADWNVVYVGDSYQAKKDDHICLDSTAAIFVTLPSNPSKSDRVKVTDIGGDCVSNNCTVLRNGEKIMKLEENDIIALDYATVIYTYLNEEFGWIKEFVSIGVS